MSIALHKEYGVNPHLTYCPRCGKEANEIILTGAGHNYSCNKCGLLSAGRKLKGRSRQDNPCPRCEMDHGWKDLGVPPPDQKLPATEICDACKAEVMALREEIQKGGIPWKCTDCKSEGVIKAESDFAIAWRSDPKCGKKGVLFDKHMCPACSAKETAA